MKDKLISYDAIIVGAGAAGLFCGANADLAAKQAAGLILDGSKSCALKLLISGGGQCNFTHGGDIKDYLDKYGDKGKKIRTALYKFNNQAVIEFFESKGVATYTREDLKVFPKSMDAKDIKNLLVKEAKSNGFTIKEGEKVLSIEKTEDESFIVNKRYITKKLVIATGGASYPTTGSDGSMFKILEGLGLAVTPLKPALAPIFVQDYPFTELSGLGLTATLTLAPRKEPAKDSASVSASGSNFDAAGSKSESKSASKSKAQKPITVTDQFLLTHKGLSGPGIFILSRYAKTGDKLVIDFLGDQVEKFNLNGVNKSILNYLIEKTKDTGLTKRFLELILENLDIDPQAKASSLPGKSAKVIYNHLRAMEFSISGTGGFNEAMATSGGVDLSEISMKTMESKKHPGLHLIGEVLDVDGNTGGYNIQFAFSSGYIAAQHILL